ncbi:MAG: hypothetical protein ACI9VR_003812 [Cognaticolwellia sp.]|jgi:hypothetical protein
MASEDIQDLEYEGLQARLSRALTDLAPETPVFLTLGDGLFDLFLDKLPKAIRASYVCSDCRRFVDRYGGLVTIGQS